MLSGTPTLPSGAGTAETGTRSLTFPSLTSFLGFVTEFATRKPLLGHIANLALGRWEEDWRLRHCSHQGQGHPCAGYPWDITPGSGGAAGHGSAMERGGSVC